MNAKENLYIIEEMKNEVLSGKYDVKSVNTQEISLTDIIDKNKSRKWNMEEVRRLNSEKRKANHEEYSLERKEMAYQKVQAIVRAYAEVYTNMTLSQIRNVYTHSYELAKENGIAAVFNKMDELMNVVSSTLRS